MGSKLNVIALISGGKDSFFSILHCIANGHDIVALANLYPPPRVISKAVPKERRMEVSTGDGEETDDLNSYMYQTVGHSVIPLYAEALDLPLYRQEILGVAINTDKSYAPSFGENVDETESLIPLLRRVMAAHPTANALSTGAILSSYQRTRVESVAIRLGLVPLSYLWQYPYLPPGLQTSLLGDMAAVGQDARIIKVASGGLDERFLWGNVADKALKMRLVRAMGRFGGSEGGAVLGEGGEYETLAVDGPTPLWKKKIVVEEDDMEVVIGEGGTAFLRIQRARLEEKTGVSEHDTFAGGLRIPHVFDEESVQLQKTLKERAWAMEERLADGEKPLFSPCKESLTTVQSKGTRAWEISNVTAPEAGDSIETQMQAIAAKLTSYFNVITIDRSASSTDHVVFTTILLRSMQDFADVNKAYATLFTEPNPPARVTVACGNALPSNVQVMLSFVIDLGPRNARQGLHVQSRSYWAPANIGPYSQAISVPLNGDKSSVPSLVYIAGQIPLIPASMQLVDESGSVEDTDGLGTFRKQTVLSLQHLLRIGKVMEVNWWTGSIAFITGRHHIQRKAAIAWQAWETLHKPGAVDHDSDQDDGTGLDAWDRKYGGLGNLSSAREIELRHPLPDFDNVIVDAGPLASFPVPSFFAVQVDELPRESQIEWQSLGVKTGPVHITEHADKRITRKTCSFEDDSYGFLYFSVFERCSVEELEQILTEIVGVQRKEECKNESGQHVTIYTAKTDACKYIQAQIIPCRSVWGYDGGKLAAGIVVRRDVKSSPHEPEGTNT